MSTNLINEDSAMVQYSADHAIADLRAGVVLSAELFRELNRTPFIDALRKRVDISDFERLKEMAISAAEPESALGISLMRRVQGQPEVRRFLFELWTTDQTYHRRWWVMFRLLGYPDLSFEHHQELFAFAQQNWERWLADVVDYFGGPDELLESLNARLRSSAWPESTTWMRVLSAAGAADPEARESFFEWAKTHRPDAPLVDEAIKLVSQEHSAQQEKVG